MDVKEENELANEIRKGRRGGERNQESMASEKSEETHASWKKGMADCIQCSGDE